MCGWLLSFLSLPHFTNGIYKQMEIISLELASWFTHWVIICCCHYLFWCSNCPRFHQWDPFHAGLCVILTCSYYSLWSSLLFGTRCSRLILPSLARARNWSFLERVLVCCSAEGFLKTKICVHSMHIVIGPLNGQS